MELRPARGAPRSSRGTPAGIYPSPSGPSARTSVSNPGEDHLNRIREHPIGAPGFEPGTSASRTQRSTGLSHAPRKKRRPSLAPEKMTGRGAPRFARSFRSASGLNRPERIPRHLPGLPERTGWDSNPRGSIRCPHALQACALNHSATRPAALSLTHAKTEGASGGDQNNLASLGGLVRPQVSLGSNESHVSSICRISAEGVGFEPTRPFRVNALAGRRLKPLGHPSKLPGSALAPGSKPRVAPPGLEPGLF